MTQTNRWFWTPLACALAAWAAACIAPDERRPGLWLPGEEAAVPTDWSFTDTHPEIALEVAAPYFLAHSITIWCVAVDGTLFVGARNPDEKRWPGWVDANPAVRLGIDGKIYKTELSRLDDPAEVAALQEAYARKYDLPARPRGDAPPMRYWRVDARRG